MKMSEIKALCADFTLVIERDGKPRCGSIVQDDRTFCSLPSHFICELVLNRWRTASSLGLVGEEDRAIIVARLKVLPREWIDMFLEGFGISRTAEIQAVNVDDALKFIDLLEARHAASKTTTEPAKRQAPTTTTATAFPAPPPPPLPPSRSEPVRLDVSLQEDEPTTTTATESTPPPPAAPVPLPVADNDTPAWDRRWSYSRAGCASACLRKFWLRYVGAVPETNPSKAFILGKLFHAGREAVDVGGTVSALTAEEATLVSEDDVARCEAMVQAYDMLRPLKIEESEVRIDIKLADGTPVVGYIDGLGAGGSVVYEFKYAAPATPYTRALLAGQACVYLAGRPDAKAFALVKAEKQQQRRKVGETASEFRARVAGALAKKDPFEIRQWPRDVFDIEGAMEELGQVVSNTRNALDIAKDMRTLPPATRSVMTCPGCSYYDLCEVIDGDRRSDANHDRLDTALGVFHLAQADWRA